MAARGMSRRIRRSPGEWSRLISEQVESGKSQREFCELHGLALSSFANAKRRALSERAEPEADEFVAIPLVRSTPVGLEVELSLGDAVVLRLRRV